MQFDDFFNRPQQAFIRCQTVFHNRLSAEVFNKIHSVIHKNPANDWVFNLLFLHNQTITDTFFIVFHSLWKSIVEKQILKKFKINFQFSSKSQFQFYTEIYIPSSFAEAFNDVVAKTPFWY